MKFYKSRIYGAKSLLGQQFPLVGLGKRGQANFFRHFRDSKDFLRNSWKKCQNLAWPRFPGATCGKYMPGQLFPSFSGFQGLPQKFVEKVQKFGMATFSRPQEWKIYARPTFSVIFMIPRTSSEIRGKSAKIWHGHVFQARRVENICQANFFPSFSQFQSPPKKFVGKRGKSLLGHAFQAQRVENVGQANFFHLFREHFLRNSWKTWKKFAWPRLQSPTCGICFWPVQLFPPFSCLSRLPQKFVANVEKVGLATFSRPELWKMLASSSKALKDPLKTPSSDTLSCKSLPENLPSKSLPPNSLP